MDLIDALHIASGKRRADEATYRQAQDMLERARPLDELGREVLFAGGNQCADCGEPYDQRGLIRRCADRHAPLDMDRRRADRQLDLVVRDV